MKVFPFQETSTEAFKEKRAFDQLKIQFDDVTNERNAANDQLKHFQSQVYTYCRSQLLCVQRVTEGTFE